MDEGKENLWGFHAGLSLFWALSLLPDGGGLAFGFQSLKGNTFYFPPLASSLFVPLTGAFSLPPSPHPITS